MIYRNSVEFSTIFNFIVYLGIDVYFKLVSVCKIRSFVEMMKVSRYMTNCVVDYVKNCNNNDILIPFDIYHHISFQFKIRKYTGKDIQKFKQFIKDNKNRLIADVIIFNIETFDYMLQMYEKEVIKPDDLS